MESNDDSPAAEEAESGRSVNAHAWVSTTYFAEGYPYTIVNNIPEVLFQQLGASLQVIGLTALFHLPWNLKFLWGPFLDRFETKRTWLVWLQFVLAGLILGLSFFVSTADLLGVVSVGFLMMGFLAATHDIAIDGYYMEGLDERGQSKFVGYRAMAYRIANLLVRGPFLILVGWVGWSFGFVLAAAVMLAVGAFHWAFLPRVETRTHRVVELVRAMARMRFLAVVAVIALAIALERELEFVSPVWADVRGYVSTIPGLGELTAAGWIVLVLLAFVFVGLALVPTAKRRLSGSDSYYAKAFVVFLAQPQVGRILAFVILFRTGESFLQKMRWPFLNGELHMSLDEYGLANGTIGLTASFIATFIGGLLIAKHGLRRWIWPFIIAQNILNLVYMGLAALPEGTGVSFSALTALIALEEFGAGLGTAVFMVYLMRCCHPEHKAAHFAVLSALMSVSFTVAGVASGFLAEAIGFANYFGFTFLATLPMMALILFIPRLDEEPG